MQSISDLLGFIAKLAFRVIEDADPDHPACSRARNERFLEGDVFRPMLSGGETFVLDTSLATARGPIRYF